MKTVNSVDELVGETPVVRLNRLAPAGAADVYVKLEYFNPSGSVKDRAALNMINIAEKNGELRPGGTIIEPTSGNTGIGLAMMAAARGYNCIVTMPETASRERIKILKAYGAEVILTPAVEMMQGAIDKAKELAKQKRNSFVPDQFNNPANPDAHRTTTAREILTQLDNQLDAFVACAGTGGTITGTGEALLQELPDLKIFTVESAHSPVLAGGEPGPHNIPGSGPGFIPSTLNQEVYSKVFHVTDSKVKKMTRRLAAREGLLLGPSSGAAVWAAIKAARALGTGRRVLAIAPDTGQRYLNDGTFGD